MEVKRVSYILSVQKQNSTQFCETISQHLQAIASWNRPSTQKQQQAIFDVA